MNEYQPVYEGRFAENLRSHAGGRKGIQRRVERILKNPYAGTEPLRWDPGKLDLRGCRSAPVGNSVRVIFVICEECRHIERCLYCFCDRKEDKTVVFLTVGSHDKAYAMK